VRQAISGAQLLGVGDIDGDARDDLVVSSTSGVLWWRAQDDGSVAPEVVLADGWPVGARVLVRDPAGGPAGIAEVVDGELVLSRGLGDGTFAPHGVIPTMADGESFAAPILAFDGVAIAPARESASCDCTDGSHVVSVGDELVATLHYAVAEPIVDIAHVDIDAIPDALVLQDGALALHLGGDVVTVDGGVAAAKLVDFDGDGVHDLAFSTTDRGFVRWADAPATWADAEPLPSAAPDGLVVPERAVDLDGDGKGELVVVEDGRHALVFAQPCE
jgi:hypothetical protein